MICLKTIQTICVRHLTGHYLIQRHVSSSVVIRQSSASTVAVVLATKTSSGHMLDQLTGRQFVDMNVDSFADITGIDPKLRLQVDLILAEYEVEKHETLKVPTELTGDHMRELLTLPIPYDRIRLMNFLYRKEQFKVKRLLDKQVKQSSSPVNKCPPETVKQIGIWDESGQQLVYGHSRNSLFQHINRPAVRRLHCHRLRHAAMFGQKVVIDLAFDKYMKAYESRLLLKQLHFVYNYNKYEAKEPFDLHFVNCSADEISMKEMDKYLRKTSCGDPMITLHYNKSYVDVFPKQSLVYLSPHADETLDVVSGEDIYIIGGLIDKSYREPISAIKAREDGIRCVRLPIHKHLDWKRGTRHLCINQVLAILHDWKFTKDWSQTLRRHIPAKKWMTDEEIAANKHLLHETNSKFI